MEKFNFLRVLVAGVLLSVFVVQHQRQTTYVSRRIVVVGLCCPSPSTFPEKLSTFDTIACNLSSSCNKHKCNCCTFSVVTLILFGTNFPTSLRSGIFFLAWSRQGIILVSFSWNCKAHSNVHTRFFRSFHVFKFYGSSVLHLSTLVSNAI